LSIVGLAAATACAGPATNGVGDAAGPLTAATVGVSSSPTGGPPGTIDVVLPSGTVPIAVMRDGDPPPLPAGANPFEVDFRGQKIRGIDIPGPGPAVVLMHGFPDNLHLYDQVYPLLAGKREVVAFDWIGWGQSDKPAPKDFPYTTATMTDELGAVVKARNLSGFTLVAHDASGPPGIDYAIANPTQVGKLVLLNTYYELNPALHPPEAVELEGDPSLKDVERAVEGDPAAVEALYKWQLKRFISNSPAAEAFIDELYTEYPEARPAYLALNDVLFPEVAARKPSQLAELKVPVAIVWGANDPYVNTGVANDFKTNIPGATLDLVPNAGPFVQFDAPNEVVRAVTGS
jgi:pimeloyl-ACP methyl ester carboxylesterase